MIKIDIISGFLGAGKTTLIRKILDEKPKNETMALIENEFGDIGIDGTLLAGETFWYVKFIRVAFVVRWRAILNGRLPN